MTIYLVKSTAEKDEETGAPLFFNLECGWGDIKSADIFTLEESKEYHLPLDAKWVAFKEEP